MSAALYTESSNDHSIMIIILLTFITTSRRFKCVIQKWAIPLDFVARRLVLFLWAFTSGATESVLNKFGFIGFGKGEIFWMKTLKRLERNGTIA